MLSIIIPVKNMEKYIKKCIDSLLEAQVDKMEIVIVDFGSTDKTLEYARQYTYDFIHIYKDDNGNASTARNLGILKSKGDYISFVDADDWIEKDFYKLSISLFEESDVDIINCGFRNICEENGNVIGIFKNEYINDIIINESNLDEFLCKVSRGNYNLEVWNKLYKKEFIQKNNILFNDINGVNGEDVFFNIMSILKHPKIANIDEIMYNHLIRSNSLSKNTANISITNRFCTIFYLIYTELLSTNTLYCLNGFSQIAYSMLIQDFINYVHGFTQLKQCINTYRSHSFFIECTKRVLKSKDSTRERKVLAFCILYKLYFVLYIIKRKKGGK